VRLFTYEAVEGIPAGVEHHDARDIMPADSVFTYAEGFGKGSPAAFANLFRYKLLLDHGGYWSDTDTVCLKPFDFAGEYVIGAERLPSHAVKDGKTARLAIGVLKVPARSAVMTECYAIASEANKREVRWGQMGPELVTRCFARHDLVKDARAEGIPVVPIPGPSAVVTALSAAGIPADHFVFEGFLPVKPGRRLNRLRELRALETTIVCYESPHRILASLEAIAQVFGEREIVVARELTKTFEEIVRGPAAALRERFAAGTARGEFTVIIPA